MVPPPSSPSYGVQPAFEATHLLVIVSLRLRSTTVRSASWAGMASAHAGRIGLDPLKVMSATGNCRTAALGGHVASETLHNLKASDVNEHAPLRKMGKNRSLIFTDLTTVPFRAYAKSR